ncbi:MAG: hypothetical protein JW771_06070 [Candidatus Thermoplasmatota archaeon]|nr:hypothetical protein [Candidatus Thermoplasmatota archaeon]
MTFMLGIRREDKNKWERRVPLIPKHISDLKEQHGIQTIIQPSPIRIFPEASYESAGAIVQEDISSCPVVFAVKEIPLDFFQRGKTYVFFSHTIKGQQNNMPMLKKMMDLECTLIDYEKILDENGRRLVFFGRYAGLAGMVDSLWALGQRLQSKGISSPLSAVKQTIHYGTLDDIKAQLKSIGDRITSEGLPDVITPLVIGFAGYGNVSKGAQEILDLFPVIEIAPQELKTLGNHPSKKHLYKVVFKEEDMVAPQSPTDQFELQDYYQHPEHYHSIFHQYLPHLTVLMNCIYWSSKYPRLITKAFLKTQDIDHFRLQVVGDVSIDINGAVEFTEKATTPDNPVFVYDPQTDGIHDGYNGRGVVVMGVDNLPCELPRASSRAFSKSLMPFAPLIAQADYTVPFDQIQLPPVIKNAIVLYQGKLTPAYHYINTFL